MATNQKGRTPGAPKGSEEAPAKKTTRKAATEEAPTKKTTRKAAAEEEAPAKKTTRKAAAAEEAPAKKTTRKAAAEEAPAKKTTRKAATEEAPTKKTARKATGTGTRRVVRKKAVLEAVALETPHASIPEDRPLDQAPAPRFLPGTDGPLLPEENLGELPSSYGVDRLVMVPRDPGWMFLHWEMSPATLARVAGRRIVLQLRCRQAAGEAFTPPREVGHQGRFYAATGESCEAMQAVLGVVTASGAVEEVLRSEWVPVPPARPRPGTARFLTIPFDEPLRVGKRREGDRYVSLEGRVVTEAEYLRLFGRAGPGSHPR